MVVGDQSHVITQFKPFSLNPVDVFLVIRDKSHVKSSLS